jgi:hypothetical protein
VNEVLQLGNSVIELGNGYHAVNVPLGYDKTEMIMRRVVNGNIASQMLFYWRWINWL